MLLIINPRTVGAELICCMNVHCLMHISFLFLPVHKQYTFMIVSSEKKPQIFWCLLLWDFSKKGKIIMPRSSTSNHNLVQSALEKQRNGASIAEVLCFINNSICGFS